MTFFDGPVGRVLNRFSKDLGITDETLPYIAQDVLAVSQPYIFGVSNVDIGYIEDQLTKSHPNSISVLRGRPRPDGGHLPLAAADPAPQRRHARPLLLRAAVLRRHLEVGDGEDH